MPFVKRPLAAIVVLLGIALAGCGSSNEPSIPVSGRLVGATSSSPGQIVLSQIGAQRIGIQTARVQAVPAPAPVVRTTKVAGSTHTTTTPAPTPRGGPSVTVPYSAVIYDADGQTYAFANVGPLTYDEVPITVERISGSSAYLLKGPKPGIAVVSVGAEELFGVQTGVLAQT